MIGNTLNASLAQPDAVPRLMTDVGGPWLMDKRRATYGALLGHA